ncbi:methylmalonyl-CoA mutase family protein [Cytobacillus sp. IB215316]|uniref:methylmalonyl-CoA mutase family protein n=1 Tax=Cytobacillus sp. IB215316 TaxID=3097354 RepID=UPI002A16B40F|nr:methylmalonyl-CoA mutase family protein [Cytobacillus sp. IB215316]MDX8359667.1 methylmalonyl-CoA mutase family protein [Cytobacillus sp. IB215316]
MKNINEVKNSQFAVPSFDDWKGKATQSLKGKSIEQLYTNTYEGIELKPLYTEEDVEGLPFLNDLPGQGSHLRGTKLLRTSGQAWDVSQEIDEPCPHQCNQVLKDDIDRGLTMIHLLLNDKTKRGFSLPNSNGKGLLVETIHDIEKALNNISLQHKSLMIDTHYCSLPMLSMLTAYFEKNNIPLETIKGTIGMDPLAALVEDGELPMNTSQLYDVMAQLTLWGKKHSPNINTILVKGHPYHNGGASAVQELAFSLATAVEYVAEALKRGLAIDDVAQKITFSFSIGANMFMEIAKLRAARTLWTSIVKSFGGNKTSQKMNIHGRTSAFTKTSYDPYVNMLRVTTEAFAAGVGGIDSLDVSSFNEVIDRSTNFSRRIARNTQIILQEEAFISKIIDPAGGSWYIEKLTNDVAKESWELFQKVEQLGGMEQALKLNFVQQEINDVATERQEHVHNRKHKIVGTNFYADLHEEPMTMSSLNKDEHVDTKNQLSIEKLARLQEVLEKDINNVMDVAVHYMREGLTISQFINLMKDKEATVKVNSIEKIRLTQSFEELRQTSDQYVEKYGFRPKVGLINLGSIPEHKPRADFITGFFEAGGFEIVPSHGYLSVEDAIEGTKAMNLATYVICGSNETYNKMAVAICRKLLDGTKDIKLYLAGKQEDSLTKELAEAGVSHIIDATTNCYEFLTSLHQEQEM